MVVDYVFSMHWGQTDRKEEIWGGREAGRKKRIDRKEGEQEGGKEGKERGREYIHYQKIRKILVTWWSVLGL